MKLAFSFLVFLALVLSGCGPLDLFGVRRLQDGVSQTTPFNDGVTQTTPLVTGEVRLASGEPAADIKVRAYVSSYQVSSTGSGLASVEARTDASGRFRLVDAPLGVNTIEAEATEDSKAIRMNVSVGVGARVSLDPLVLQPTGVIAGQVTASGGVNLLGTTVFIPGTQYVAMTAENGTYTLRHVPVGTYEVAAMRQTFATTVVSGVTVRPQQTTQAPELALRLDAPVLESLSQSNGGTGTELILRGRNFGASKNTVLVVTFGTMQATRTERVSDTEVRVWVPDGALTGPVGLRSNGVASNTLDFQVIASLRLIPYYAGLYVGDRQTFEVEALDTRGTPVVSPNVRWNSGASPAGTLDPSGAFLGSGEGWSEIRVTSGAITGLAAVGVTRYQVNIHPSALDPRQVRVNSASETPEGSVVFSDWQGDRVYHLDAQGNLTRLAGTGLGPYTPDGTLALEASLRKPSGIVMDSVGNVYFSESDAHRIRVIPSRDGTLFGREVLAGRLTTLAGTGAPGFNGDGAAVSKSLFLPKGLILDRDGALIVVDAGNRRIRRLSPDGQLVTLAGGGASPFTGWEMDPHHYGDVIGFAIAQDAAGNVFFHNAATTFGQRLFMLCRQDGIYFGQPRRAGVLYALTGGSGIAYSGDGPGMQTRVMSPETLVMAASGDLLISERGGRIVKRLDPQGRMTTLAGAYLPSTYSIVPPVPLPAPATAQMLSLTFMRSLPDGSLLLWDLASTWRLTPVRPDPRLPGN